MPNHSYIIVVDWGTSYLRAYLCKIEVDGTLHLNDIKHSLGVNKIAASFEDTLMTCILPWVNLYGKLPIFMSGQIGSSIGWKETVYLSCPISPLEIVSGCLEFECNGHFITIIPGLSCKLSNDNYDAMRGEELQVLGWLQLDPHHSQGEYLICLPGTHTKWVLVQNGEIQLFKTAMTGELYDLLTNNSVLIQEKSNVFDEVAFNQGANFTLNSERGSFTHGLFSVRSKQLFGELSAAKANSYLSGLLIGSDVRAAVNANEWRLELLDNVVIIGAQQISDLFAKVLNSHGVTTSIYNVTDTTILGFNCVYQQTLSAT